MATPVKKRRRTPVQLAAEGFAVLVEKLGMADAIRYVQFYHRGEGDYTRERHQWLGQLSHEQVVQLMTAAQRRRERTSKT